MCSNLSLLVHWLLRERQKHVPLIQITNVPEKVKGKTRQWLLHGSAGKRPLNRLVALEVVDSWLCRLSLFSLAYAP